MLWQTYCVTPKIKPIEARNALNFALEDGIEFLILCSSDGSYMGVLTFSKLITWMNSDKLSPLESIANTNHLVLRLGNNTHRTRRVMSTKQLKAVPSVKDGKVVGTFRI